MVAYQEVRNGSVFGFETFGGCPECGLSTGFTHCGRKRWYFCATHKTKWCGGEVLSCYWKIEVSEEYTQSEAEIGAYREVESLPPTYPSALKAELEMSETELAQHLHLLAQSIESSAEQRFGRIRGETEGPVAPARVLYLR